MKRKEQYPAFTTTYERHRNPDVVRGESGVWLYRSMPLLPVVDARSARDAAAAMGVVANALAEVAAESKSAQVPHRNLSRSRYREFHLLALNVPRPFEPAGDTELAAYLRQHFRTEEMARRLFIGVRLVPTSVTSDLRHAVSSTMNSLIAGRVNLEEFIPDAGVIDRALRRSGCASMTNDDYELAESWWNAGQRPDITMLEHPTHIHLFGSAESAQHAYMTQGATECAEWPGSHAFSGLIVRRLGIEQMKPVTSPELWWGAWLMRSQAVAVSVRGLLEPPAVTRHELRKSRTRIYNDQAELGEAGVADRAELIGLGGDLTDAEDTYANPSAPPAVIDGTAVVWVPGTDHERYDGLFLPELYPAEFRQRGALLHTLMCSSANPLRAPSPFDAPSTAIASFALNNLSSVGERGPNNGRNALVGFTEQDAQPVWMSPIAQSRGDNPPIALVVGQTGSGKTMLMLWLAHQLALAGTPVVIVDPKTGSDHSAAVALSGGRTYSLDGLIGDDGVLDPLRTALSPQAGIDMAASMLLGINPWGSAKEDIETPLVYALQIGVENGATTTGGALLKAQELHQAPATLVDPILHLHRSSGMFRALVGINPSGEPLNVADGITYITVGTVHFDLPAPGAQPTQVSQQQRISLAMVRSLVVASSMALAGRDGVVMLDEAWVFTDAGATELDRLGRLARSQRVLPMLFTQRVSDALRVGLANYISQVIVLPIQEEEEARAALKLAGLDATTPRVERLRARAVVGDQQPQPNLKSMRALVDPVTREVLRGAIGLYSDLNGRTIPVEISIPPEFVRHASTNADDEERRKSTPNAMPRPHIEGS